MQKHLLLSFLAIWSSFSMAASVTTVTLKPDTNLAVYGTTNIRFQLGTTEASGDATSESAPSRVYVPMDGPNSAANDEARFFTVKGVTTLFSAASTAMIDYPLYLNTTATDYYLYVAVKDMTSPSNPYKIAKKFAGGPYNNVTNSTLDFPLSIAEVCTQTASCTNFSSTGNTEKVAMAYFFLNTSNVLGIGSTMTPGTGGLYYEINMSNRVYLATDLQPVITEIRSGDKRVTVKYSSGTTMTNAKSMRFYSYGSPAASPGDNLPIQDSFAIAGTDFLSKEYPYAVTGSEIVTNLENEKVYNLGVLFVDQYKFGTVVSNYKEATPLTVEELLKKNACFLLTAGFGEDHFVIDYFRHFRDNVLSHSFLGRAFISVYYEYAPKYALMIYQHESIRAMIRGAAFFLYFIFNYFFLLVIFGAVICALNLYKNKDKIKI
ncbi:MAG: hypothetical protein K2Q18_17130 [Bdellovibrionales bacterium]|nr:hypothetical protein [Bdellovibrionales bacterium]